MVVAEVTNVASGPAPIIETWSGSSMTVAPTSYTPGSSKIAHGSPAVATADAVIAASSAAPFSASVPSPLTTIVRVNSWSPSAPAGPVGPAGPAGPGTPPWSGPLSAPTAATTADTVSDPVDATTRAVKVDADGRARSAERPPERELVISVSDSSPAVAPEIREKIF